MVADSSMCGSGEDEVEKMGDVWAVDVFSVAVHKVAVGKGRSWVHIIFVVVNCLMGLVDGQ